MASPQSVLDPAGTNAEQIKLIADLLFIGGGAIFVFVMLLIALSLYGPAPLRKIIAHRWSIIGGGILFPVVTLTALLIYTLLLTSKLINAEGEAAVKIEVVGERWWWRVRYLRGNDQVWMVTANEIRIPVGQPVDLVLTTADVIHSFWVPNLAGKLDMIPGQANTLRLVARKAGAYRGLCAEYCGEQHAKMAFYVIALAPEDFSAWLAAQEQPAREPGDDFLRRGQDLFIAGDCIACHTVRGTPARGDSGPDLTHVGSRLSIGAGILPTNRGTLAGWIASSQHLKPANLMPSFDNYSSEDLRAIAAYLESLR